MPHKKAKTQQHLTERILEIIRSEHHGSICSSGDLYNRFCVAGKCADRLYTSEELTQAISTLLSEKKIEDFGDGFYGLPRTRLGSDFDPWEQEPANI